MSLISNEKMHANFFSKKLFLIIFCSFFMSYKFAKSDVDRNTFPLRNQYLPIFIFVKLSQISLLNFPSSVEPVINGKLERGWARPVSD